MRGIYGRFDSKIRFEIESDGRFDSRFDSNAKKNDSQVPNDDDDDDVADLSSITDELLPLCAKLSACVRVSLPSLVILRKDALSITEVHHECVHCRFAVFHARL